MPSSLRPLMILLLTITGPTQCGKTHLAHRIATLLREDGRPVSVIDARHALDDHSAPPIFPERLAMPAEIHVSECFPPRQLE